MSTLSLAALTIGVIAVIAMAFGLPDPWFFGLLALACLLGAADAAYQELKVWAVALLTLGAACGTAALWCALRQQRTGEGDG